MLGVLVFVCVGSILFTCSTQLELPLKKIEITAPIPITPSSSFGSFQDAISITADNLGNIFVLDNAGPSIFKYSIDGDSVRSLSSSSANEFGFDSPQDIDASLGNFIAVADYGNNRIQFYNRDLIRQFTFDGARSVAREEQFGLPLAVSMSSTGICYLIDGEGKRVIKLSPQTEQVVPVGSIRLKAYITDPTSLAIGPDDNAVILNRDGVLVAIDLLGEAVAVAALPRSSERELEKRKVARIENDILVVNAIPGVLSRLSRDLLAVIISYHISGADLDIRDVAYSRGKLYVLTQQKVLVCSISK